jgi:hypothetical protein
MAKHRRSRSSTSAVPTPSIPVDPLPLTLRDVYLLTTDAGQEMAVGSLTVVVDHPGLSVLAPDGRIAAVLTWSDLTVLRTAGPVSAPGGENAVLLVAASRQRSHRFAVPTSDPVALEATIAEITGVPAPDPPPRRRRRR